MLSKYFVMKIETQEFKYRLNNLIEELSNKKVLLYGAGEGFECLLEKYQFSKLNIIAIADKKFNEETMWHNIKAISPNKIEEQDYDIILITNEYYSNISSFLNCDLDIENEKIETIFKECIKEESINYNYLEQYNFGKHLLNLNKKLKNKKIVIYGAGGFFEVIKKYYDLSKLNIIGISDRRFEYEDEETFLGYKTVEPDKIKELKPDYVLVATKFFLNVIDDLDENVLHGSKIKIKPLIKKPFMTLFNEIWG